MDRIITLGALAPPDTIIKDVPCQEGTCELVISGEIPLMLVLKLNQSGQGGYSDEYVQAIRDILEIKTDKKIVDSAFKAMTSAQFRSLDGQIGIAITAMQTGGKEIEKKNSN